MSRIGLPKRNSNINDSGYSSTGDSKRMSGNYELVVDEDLSIKA